jgi:isoleucyl-tRNA synthetase
VVERLAGLIAPVLCHMAEDIWQNLPYAVAERSVFERGWPQAAAEWRLDAEALTAVCDLLALRPLVNRQLESCRSQGSIGASLEARVQLAWGPNRGGNGAPEGSGNLDGALALLERRGHPEVDALADWLLVSRLSVGGDAPAEVLAEASEEGVTVRVARAGGAKCERCWHYEDDIGAHSQHPTLCGRCVAVLDGRSR